MQTGLRGISGHSAIQLRQIDARDLKFIDDQPYDFSSGGMVSSIQASDLFFRQSGVLQYGIPLIDHGGNAVNGNSMGN